MVHNTYKVLTSTNKSATPYNHHPLMRCQDSSGFRCLVFVTKHTIQVNLLYQTFIAITNVDSTISGFFVVICLNIRPSQTVPKKRERTSQVRSRSPFGTEKTKNKKTNPRHRGSFERTFASKFVQTKKKTNLIHFSFCITKSKYNDRSTTTHH